MKVTHSSWPSEPALVVFHVCLFVCFLTLLVTHLKRHIQLNVSHIANVMLPNYMAKGEDIEREWKGAEDRVLRCIAGKVQSEGVID